MSTIFSPVAVGKEERVLFSSLDVCDIDIVSSPFHRMSSSACNMAAEMINLDFKTFPSLQLFMSETIFHVYSLMQSVENCIFGKA